METQQGKINRRQFLKTTSRTLAGAALASSTLGAVSQRLVRAGHSEDRYDFLMPRVKFACDSRVHAPWNVYPGADRNLLMEFNSVVRCKVKLPSDCKDMNPTYGREDQFNAVVDFTEIEQLRRYPFLFMTAEGYYTFNNTKKTNLKRYIEQGGFLLLDDCVFQSSGDFFYQGSYKLLEEVFGPGSVKRVPNSHEIFHNVYDLGKVGLPVIQGQNHGARGVFVGDRLAVFLSATDIHCGWTRFLRTNRQRQKETFQMGINIIMYALSH